GAPEAVDRLLRVPDDGEAAGPELHAPPLVGLGAGLAEEEDDLALERVGVLELVDEDMVEERLELTAYQRAVAKHVAQLHEEVELVEDRALYLHLLVELRDHEAEPREACTHPGRKRGDELALPRVAQRLVELHGSRWPSKSSRLLRLNSRGRSVS